LHCTAATAVTAATAAATTAIAAATENNGDDTRTQLRTQLISGLRSLGTWPAAVLPPHHHSVLPPHHHSVLPPHHHSHHKQVGSKRGPCLPATSPACLPPPLPACHLPSTGSPDHRRRQPTPSGLRPGVGGGSEWSGSHGRGSGSAGNSHGIRGSARRVSSGSGHAGRPDALSQAVQDNGKHVDLNSMYRISRLCSFNNSTRSNVHRQPLVPLI
jgi:hypothetical protein